VRIRSIGDPCLLPNTARNAASGLLLCCALVACKATPPADLVLVKGHIYTSNPAAPWAEAVAIREGKILLAGTNGQVEKYHGAGTQVIDLGGRMAMPGIIDTHTHFLWGSAGLAGVLLYDAKTVEQVRQILLDYAKAHPLAKANADEKWIYGAGWNYGFFPTADGLPTKALLDEAFPDRPAAFLSSDGHSLWVNSRALAAANIKHATPNPGAGGAAVRGIIVRDTKSGEATGVLEEGAKNLVLSVMPVTYEQKLSHIRLGMIEANSHGVTGVVNATGDIPEMELYQELHQRGELTVRMTTAFATDVGVRHTISPEELATFDEARRRFHDDWVRAGIIKFFADGVIETHTAAMLEPYANTPHGKPGQAGQKGSTLYTPEEFHRDFLELDKHGYQVMTHAIGDGAVRTTLDAYEAVEKENGPRDRRWRIEHIEAIKPVDVPRFAKLGVIVSVQPWCCPSLGAPWGDEPWADNVGASRLSEGLRWHDLAASGALMINGSDWPVDTLNPFPTMQIALTRQAIDGKPAEGFYPEQRLTLPELLAGYTRNGAYAEFMEDKVGSLESGKLADVIVLSQDLFQVPPNSVGKTKVVLTVVGGKVVWRQGM
jgi:predicted amidohydrolase YtcJ